MNWNFLRKQALLRYTQWRSPERLREFQEKRLRKLIVHAYDRCAYYRRQMDDRGIHPTEIRNLNDLARLPVFSRKAVAESFSEISASNAKRFRPEKGYTSGSTGPKLMLVVDRDAIDMGNAAIWRFRGWHGIRFGHRIAEIRLPDPCTSEDLEALRRELDDELAGRLHVSIQVCESLEQTVGGKHRTVVSKVPIEI